MAKSTKEFQNQSAGGFNGPINTPEEITNKHKKIVSDIDKMMRDNNFEYLLVAKRDDYNGGLPVVNFHYQAREVKTGNIVDISQPRTEEDNKNLANGLYCFAYNMILGICSIFGSYFFPSQSVVLTYIDRVTRRNICTLDFAKDLESNKKQ